MTSAFYLLALSALFFYINVHTQASYFDDKARRRKNVCWYAGWLGLLLSLITAILDNAL